MVGFDTSVRLRLPFWPVSFSSSAGPVSPGALPGQRSITTGFSAARAAAARPMATARAKEIVLRVVMVLIPPTCQDWSRSPCTYVKQARAGRGLTVLGHFFLDPLTLLQSAVIPGMTCSVLQGYKPGAATMRRVFRPALTLIELLVVIAIIAV